MQALETQNDISDGLTHHPLKTLKTAHPDKILIGHLNINSLRNKYNQFHTYFHDNVDVMLVSETKLDESFTNAQFKMNNYHAPFRHDRNKFGGGLMMYINSNIICSRLTMPSHPKDFEAIFVELNLRSQKWLVIGAYKSPSQSSQEFLRNIESAISSYSYENIVVMGDFNIDIHDKCLEDFKINNNLTMLVKDPTCYKSLINPTTIDHIWVTNKQCFMKTSVIETGLSDFHQLTVTVLNKKQPKKAPKVKQYRSYKGFDQMQFKSDLQHVVDSFESSNILEFDIFDQKLKDLVNRHLPMKKKHLRSNDGPFMNKRLRKEIMLRSRKRNAFNKNPIIDNWIQFKRQRNKCVKLVRQAKTNFYSTLSLKVLSDQKTFWNTVKPIFNEKSLNEKVCTLVENESIVSNHRDIAEVMNDYFVNITHTLDIPDIPKSNHTNVFDDKIDKIIHQYHSHPSIVAIKNSYPTNKEFVFKNTKNEEVRKHIQNLDVKKSTPQNDIPTKLLKENIDILDKVLTKSYNYSNMKNMFPESLKCADVSPLFKKGDKSDKKNYRPISKLPNLSKVFERIMHNDISNYMSSRLSPLLSGFRSKYSTQHALLSMIEKWHRELDKGNIVSGVLMDLSKAFDCINHELLLAKLHAYGFSKSALHFILSYLQCRSQRVCVEGQESSLKELFIGVPQGSILGPLLFNIYVNDLFLFINDPHVFLCNYADDNTLYTFEKDPSIMMKRLHDNMSLISTWYKNNGLQLNPEKCQLIVFKGNKKYNDFNFTLNLGNVSLGY